MRFPLALTLAFVIVTSGCIKLEEENATTPTKATAPAPAAERMDGRESKQESVTVCPGGLSLPSPQLYCAKRIVTVSGSIQVNDLPVVLATFNGNVDLSPGATGGWNLTATLETRAESEAEARERLNEIDYSWSHFDGDDHFIKAIAKKTTQSSGYYAARLELKLPSSIPLVLTASTSNGDIVVQGFRADQQVLSTSNGDITVNGDFQTAVLSTSNGNVHATLTPVASGAITISTSNGNIDLAVPEDGQRGYDIDASTSNGKVNVSMRDGTTTGERATHKHFTSTDFAGRAIQVQGTLSTSNGDVDLSAK